MWKSMERHEKKAAWADPGLQNSPKETKKNCQTEGFCAHDMLGRRDRQTGMRSRARTLD